MEVRLQVGINDDRVFVVDRMIRFIENEETRRTTTHKRLKFEVYAVH